MRQFWWHQALIVVVAVTVLFTNLGGPRLWDRDEPRNAGCAKEMLDRGDWITPTFNAELRSHKPVLLYWLMMVAYQAFGVNEFAARFWSAFLGVGTALLVYSMGRRLLSAQAGLWAGLAVATSLMFGVAARAATPDSLIMFLSTAAIAIYVWGTFRAAEGDQGPEPWVADRYFPQSRAVAISMYAVMGLGVLAKGPVGLVLPTAVIGMFMLLQRLPARSSSGWYLPDIARAFSPAHFLRTCWAMRPLTAILTAAAVALPWYLWVGVRTEGEFTRVFFFEHNFGRAAATMEGHSGGPWFYPLALLVGLFPWSVFAAPIAIDTRYRLRGPDPHRLGYTLALCWAGVYVVLFSVAQTKLPSYVTPCYPGVALLIGGFVAQFTQGTTLGSRLWSRLAMVALILVGTVLLVALPVAASEFLPGEEWLGLVGLIPILGGALAWACWEYERRELAAAVFATSAVVLLTSALGGVASRVSEHQQAQQLLQVAQQRGSSQLASFGLLEPSWIFYGGQPITELPWSGRPESLGSWVEVGGKWQPKPPIGVSDVAASPDDWLIITTDDYAERLLEMLPEDYGVLSSAPYFLKDQELLLVGKTTWVAEGVRPTVR